MEISTAKVTQVAINAVLDLKMTTTTAATESDKGCTREIYLRSQKTWAEEVYTVEVALGLGSRITSYNSNRGR